MVKKQVTKAEVMTPDATTRVTDSTVIKTIRIPTDIFRAAEDAARKVGSNFNDTVINLLRKHLDLPSDEGTTFIQKMHTWVGKNFQENDFPENVTYLVFQHIRETPALLKEYQRITQKQEDKEGINRRIGRMVKQALNATVIGRSLPLTQKGELITSYALLRVTEKS